MEWISVDGRLPEFSSHDKLVSDKVLVAYGVKHKFIQLGWRRIDGWVTQDMVSFARQEFITHWMPLPAPPKED